MLWLKKPKVFDLISILITPKCSECTLESPSLKNYIEDIDEFIYLGSPMSSDGSSDEDIQARFAKTKNDFRTIKNFWSILNISQHTKLWVFKSNVLSTLLCGSES